MITLNRKGTSEYVMQYIVANPAHTYKDFVAAHGKMVSKRSWGRYTERLGYRKVSASTGIAPDTTPPSSINNEKKKTSHSYGFKTAYALKYLKRHPGDTYSDFVAVKGKVCCRNVYFKAQKRYRALMRSQKVPDTVPPIKGKDSLIHRLGLLPPPRDFLCKLYLLAHPYNGYEDFKERYPESTVSRSQYQEIQATIQ